MTKATEIFEKVPAFEYSEDAASTDTAVFETVVRTRRSTRVYTDEPVPE